MNLHISQKGEKLSYQAGIILVPSESLAWDCLWSVWPMWSHVRAAVGMNAVRLHLWKWIALMLSLAMLNSCCECLQRYTRWWRPDSLTDLHSTPGPAGCKLRNGGSCLTGKEQFLFLKPICLVTALRHQWLWLQNLRISSLQSTFSFSKACLSIRCLIVDSRGVKILLITHCINYIIQYSVMMRDRLRIHRWRARKTEEINVPIKLKKLGFFYLFFLMISGE